MHRIYDLLTLVRFWTTFKIVICFTFLKKSNNFSVWGLEYIPLSVINKWHVYPNTLSVNCIISICIHLTEVKILLFKWAEYHGTVWIMLAPLLLCGRPPVTVWQIGRAPGSPIVCPASGGSLSPSFRVR